MQITTVVGIVVAVIIILMGLKIFFRKPNDAAPSLESELHINADSQLPIIPRHVRDQLQFAAEPENVQRVEPQIQPLNQIARDTVLQQTVADEDSETAQAVTAVKVADPKETIASNLAADPAAQTASSLTQSDAQTAVQPDTTTTQTAETTQSNSVENVEEVFNLNPNVAAAQISEFDDESSILDTHLHEQQRYDDESSLSNAETIIALNVYPNPRKALSGDKTLKVLLKYGLRFGELSCFHRYEATENSEDVSPLMFSVLRITDEGPNGFDLETLSGEQVQGLAFFLALPHNDVQKGFDTMVSIAGLIAREVDGTVYDENNLEFTPQLKEHWRHKAIDYRSGQEV
ncbi:cell division protein ZipA [Acinetobacter calcoaceticus]|uniref:Cell division protein ZipA n=1 Tax=Acinetobacter calcoaceticus TaxID=471 RepID=A0A4R1Y007_ACICA|nr:cell division protein ZipA [Acinetobacter calcoaceticus]